MTLIIYYTDGTNEKFKAKNKQAAKEVVANRGTIQYATFGNEVIAGTRPVKPEDELNEIIESGDLERFNNYFKGLHL